MGLLLWLIAIACGVLLYLSVLIGSAHLAVSACRTHDYDCAFGGALCFLFMLGCGALLLARLTVDSL
ncbi:hypothetical protein ABID65_007530 [Bradyrhizobium sp. S3.9.2]|uniref:hypothetical protein n=1 Tax=Bradyrhizobium sp. S3.9.2 TaxID=3156432 RepID=UPI0033963ECE